MTRRKLIAGNWKMHGHRAALDELDRIVAATRGHGTVDVAICPPFTLIAAAAARAHHVMIGGQDCHGAGDAVDGSSAGGAHTGDIAAAMLADAGAKLCIVGHSERRLDHGETDAAVRAKATAAIAAGLTAIVCVGETAAQRDAGDAVAVVTRQLAQSLPATRAGLVVAYEPIWAIGSGRTPSPGDVAQVHGAIRAVVGGDVRILYGGSVKPGNAADLLHVDDVDGALVGGASLLATDFAAIVTAAAVRTGTGPGIG